MLSIITEELRILTNAIATGAARIDKKQMKADAIGLNVQLYGTEHAEALERLAFEQASQIARLERILVLHKEAVLAKHG